MKSTMRQNSAKSLIDGDFLIHAYRTPGRVTPGDEVILEIDVETVDFDSDSLAFCEKGQGNGGYRYHTQVEPSWDEDILISEECATTVDGKRTDRFALVAPEETGDYSLSVNITISPEDSMEFDVPVSVGRIGDRSVLLATAGFLVIMVLLFGIMGDDSIY